MGTRTIATVLKVEGEESYKSALKNASGELRVLKSELERVSSEYRTNANSMEALTKKGEVLSRMYDVQEQRIATLKSALEKSMQIRDAEQQSVNAARDAYFQAKKALDSYGEEVDKSSQEYQQAKAECDKLRDAVIEHQAKLDSSTAAVNKYQSQLNRASVELGELKDRQDENNRLLQESQQSADGCATSIDRYGDTVRKAADGTESSVSAVEALSSALVASGVQQKVSELAGAMMECGTAAAEYELSLAKVATLADSSVLSQKELKNGILQLSSELGTGADEISEAAYQALSAGVKTANVLDFTRQATQLSIAGFTDAANAVDVLSTVLNAYGMTADQTEAVASKLVETQNLGKITVDELGKVLGRVIPSAAAYGVNLDNVAAAYANMTASGINAENTTTYLSTMMDELADSGSAVASVLKEQTGKSFAELMESGASLGDVLDVIGRSVGNDKVQFSNLWSSATAGKAALALFNSGAEKFNATLTAMENSSGSVAENYAKLADTSDYASRRLETASQNLKIAVGDQLNPVLDNLRNAGASILETASEIIANNPVLVSTITGLVTALGLLAGGISALMIVKSVTAAMAALNITLAANPVGLVAVGIAGLVAALATFVSHAEASKAEIEALTEASRAFSETVSTGEQTYTDSVASATAASEAVSGYIRRLEELERQGLDTQAAQLEYQMVLDKINALMPELNAELDAQTGMVKGGTEALKDQAEAWRRNAIAEAAYTRYKDDLSAMADAEYEVAKNQALLSMAEDEAADIRDKLRKNTLAYNQAEARKNQILEQTTQYSDEEAAALAEIQQEMWRLEEESWDLNLALEDNAGKQAELNTAIEQGSQTIEENRATVEAATQAYSDMSETVVESGEDTAGAVADASESIQGSLSETRKAYYELWESARESLDRQIGLFDDLSGKCDMSTRDMIENLRSQREAFDNYATNIQTAMARGIDQGLVQKLSDGSVESMQILAELVTATDEEIAQINEAFNGLEESKDIAAGAMAGTKQEMIGILQSAAEEGFQKAMEAGKNLVDGYMQGIRNKMPKYRAIHKELADAGVNEYKDANLTFSPSRRYRWLAAQDVEGLVVQYQADTPKLRMAAAKMADSGYMAAINARRAAIPSVTSVVAATAPKTSDGQIIQLLTQLLSAVKAGKQIVLDSGEYVGATVDQYNEALGTLQILSDRGAV